MSMIGMFRRIPASKVSGLVSGGDEVMDLVMDGGLNVDKAWHGIHFVLSGRPWDAPLPLGFILGGTPCGDEDVGYGPARALTAAEVKSVAAALQPLDRAAFEARIDPRALAREQIHGHGGSPQRLSEEQEYLGSYYEQLRTLVLDAAKAGDGLLLWIC